MPRFHFDVLHEESFLDDEGVELADSEAMQREVMRTAGTMVSEMARFPDKPWKMIVREGRKIVATLTFEVG